MKKSTELKAIKKLRKQILWNSGIGEILVKDMSIEHVQNTVILLTKKNNEAVECGILDYEVGDMLASEWIEIFKDELEYRKSK